MTRRRYEENEGAAFYRATLVVILVTFAFATLIILGVELFR